ncbi:MAG: ABC transporter substrate-binding protein [Acidimicrobiaceae bacterium]|nr:ABC transporter substrate-binding protein [Acidimicrobiaceae bacterium]
MQSKRLLIIALSIISLATACGAEGDAESTRTTAPASEAANDADGDADKSATPDDSGSQAPAPETDAEPSASEIDVDAVLAADLNSCEAVPSGETLRIGYAADFSELGGFVDIPGSAAAEYFVELLNCRGGVDGRPVELIVRDIEGNPETAGRVAQELLDDKVSAILGPAFFDVNQAILQVTAGKTPLISVSSTEPLLADPAQLSLLASFTDTAQAKAAARFAIEQGWQTSATFSVPGPYFGYLVEVFTEEYEALGGRMLDDYPFVPAQTTDFSAQVNQIAALEPQPDVIYSALIAFQAAILRGQLDEAGVGSEMLLADAFSATGGYFTDGVEGFFHTSHTFPEPDGRMLKFLDSYEQVKGSALESDSYSALAADAILVIAAAVIETGSLDPGEVGRAMIAGTGIDGLTGVLRYNGGGTPNTPVYVHEVVDGGPNLAAVYEVNE